MTELEILGTLKFPNAIYDELNGTRWQAWLSPNERAATRQGQRLKYADWLKSKELQQKGVYIWTQEVEPDLLRFIHVGISQKGNSTLATRTKYHLRRQLSQSDRTRDRIHQLTFDGTDRFGTLGPDLRCCEKGKAAAEEFVKNLRVLYLIPASDQSLNALRVIEGVLAYAASYLLDTDKTDRTSEADWETTNTLSKTTNWTVDLVKAECVSDWLRELSHCMVLPNVPRRTQ